MLHSRKAVDRCVKCGGKADSCKDEVSNFTDKIPSKSGKQPSQLARLGNVDFKLGSKGSKNGNFFFIILRNQG